MKFFASIILSSLAIWTSISASPVKEISKISARAVTRGSGTLVMKERGGIPGNECLTFRNNGELVNAACVLTAADRQVTPSELDGQPVLLVQRSFTAQFRKDLVNVEACVGLAGSTFKAVPCEGLTETTAVTLAGNTLTAGSTCHSGHNDAAQITVDKAGKNCAAVQQLKATAARS